MTKVVGFRRGLTFLVVLLLVAMGSSAGSLGATEAPRGGSLTCFGLTPTIVGGPFADTLTGTAGNDVIAGLEGNDTIFGMGGADRICGGPGNDFIFGGPGSDQLQGGAGGDIVYGEAGRDTLYGGARTDTLNGGSENDRCYGGETYVSCELPSVDQLLAACPTASEIARIDAHLTLTFEADPTSPFLACFARLGSENLTPLQKRAYNAVRIMQRISFDAALPWTSLRLSDWLFSAIEGIRFRDDITLNFCCDPAGVINLKSGTNAQEADLWMRHDPFNLGIAHLVIIMVHEARHSQGYPHTCEGGTDDNTKDQLGSWGVQYYLELWLADHTSPVFLAGPPGDPSYYQDTHRTEAQQLDYASFCDE